MITTTNTNIFNSDSQTLVNTVNCVGVMGKGIALEYKKRYPDMFLKYRDLCFKNQIKVGNDFYVYNAGNRLILNFPTKVHWRNNSKYEYISIGLDKFVETYTNYGITSISFPMLGTSNGGLDKSVVLDLMISKLSQLPIDIKIHV